MAKERPKLVSVWFKLNHWITQRIHIGNVPVSDKAAIRIAWTGHRLVFCLQCTILAIPGPTFGTLVKRKQQHFLNFKYKESRHAAAEAMHCMYTMTPWKIDVRKRGADSSSSSGELGRCLECFSARNIIPTEQSVPASTSPHSAG